MGLGKDIIRNVTFTGLAAMLGIGVGCSTPEPATIPELEAEQKRAETIEELMRVDISNCKPKRDSCYSACKYLAKRDKEYNKKHGIKKEGSLYRATVACPDQCLNRYSSCLDKYIEKYE